MAKEREGGSEQAARLLEELHDDIDHSPSSVSRVWRYLMGHYRLLLEGILVAALCTLLTFYAQDSRQSRGPVPRLPSRRVTFLPNDRYLTDKMFFSEKDTLDTLHSWLELSSEALGYVSVPDWEEHSDMQDPYIVRLDRMTEGPGYMISVFHQLHCLSYLVQHFQKGFAGVQLSDKIAHHSAHCFDYLRQSIMCNADTSLEGNTTYGPGWGSVHSCIDYKALLAWANEHKAQERRGTMPNAIL